MKNKVVFLLLVVASLVFLAQGYYKKNNTVGGCTVPPQEVQETVSLRDGDLPTGTEKITFVELGSMKCIPCKQMQPIMTEIEKEYAGLVKVVFHDVWTSEGKQYGREYGVRLIPTQVFIDSAGNEIARHEGFFSKVEIEDLFKEHGVVQ